MVEPLLLVSQYWVIIELFALSFAEYPSIRIAILVVQLFAFVLAIIAGFISYTDQSNYWIARLQNIHRCVITADLVFIGTLLLSLTMLPVQLTRNVRRFVAGFSSIFVVDAVLLFITEAVLAKGAGPYYVNLVNWFSNISLFVTGAIYAWWAFSVRLEDEGHERQLISTKLVQPETEDRLRQHITTLDDTLKHMWR